MEIKYLYDKTKNEFDLDSGVMAFGSFERLLPLLNEFFAIKAGEKIEGIKINKDGIQAKVKTI